MTINIQTIKQGDTFYECDYGINVEYIALCDPYRAEQDSGWALLGKAISSSNPKDVLVDEQEFFCSDQYPAYGPKLYSYPAYD